MMRAFPLQIPGLVVWTSALPESTGFLRRQCYPLQGREDPDSPEDSLQDQGSPSPVILLESRDQNETFVHECGTEPMHSSQARMTKAIQMMFAELCSEYLDSETLGQTYQNQINANQLSICCSDNT